MSENNNNGKKLEHRLTKLEVHVRAILDNHLPHIQEKLGRLETKAWAILVGLLMIMGGIIATYLK